MRIPSLLLLGLAAFPVCAQAMPASRSAEADLRAVIETFRTSILAKDQARFLALFHGESIPWLAVLDEASLQQVRSRRPGYPKADPLGAPGPRPFIEGIVASQVPQEETFSGIRIDTDGQIASVSFDYTFLRGGQPTNRGQESWHLVNTDHGWKISAVIFSVHLNPAPLP